MPEKMPRILVALDGSERAISTVRYMAYTLRPQAARVVLFGVLETVPASFWDMARKSDLGPRLKDVHAWAAGQRKKNEAFMEKAKHVLLKAGHPESLVSIKVVDRAHGIAQDVMREAQGNYHTVVFGRRGMGAFRGLVLGSVAVKLITNLVNRPLWVVGKDAKPPRFLLSMDGSENSLRAVEYFAAVCGGNAVEIKLLHVVRGDSQLAFLKGRDSKQHAEKVMARAQRRLLGAGFDAQQIGLELVEGADSRAQAIVSLARKGSFGTIVMGRKGVSDNSEFPLGRVSQKVLQMSRGLAVWLIP